MDFKSILALCDKGEWRIADAVLNPIIRDNSDQPKVYAMAAHVILRQGNTGVARWLINRAQGIEPDNMAARIEDICIDFYEARYESAYRKIYPGLIESAQPEHPIYFITGYLCCLYSDSQLYESFKEYFSSYRHWVGFKNLPKLFDMYLSQADSALISIGDEKISWHAVDEVLRNIKSGDKLFACIVARYTEIFFPSEANSFLALGIFNLHAGFFDNAGGNFYEAMYRKSEHTKLVDAYRFCLFCRQHRFQDAIDIGYQIEKLGNLDLTGHGLLLEAMLRSGYDIKVISKKLELLEWHVNQKKQRNPYIEIIKMRLQLLDGQLTQDQAIEIIRSHVDRPECHASYLYFYAELLESKDARITKQYATRALSLDPLHPDAEHWDNHKAINHINFEYAGLFIPKEHEGGAWPTGTQLELLDILFLTADDQRAKSWELFTKNHSIYSLEAGAYRLLPFVYKKLSASLSDDHIAEIDLLKGIWKKSYFENALRVKNILGLVQTIENNGIEVILLKGLANALSLYGDLGSRPMADVDILIHPSKVELVHKLLTAQGWLFFGDNLPTPERIRFQYASTYKHPRQGTLDVHWCPCDDFHCDFYAPSDIGHVEYIDFLGRKWAMLSPTANLLCTILHGVNWNHLSPVRWVSDALLILHKFRDQIDWSRIHHLARKYYCATPLAMGLKFLSRYDKEFLAVLPNELLSMLSADYENDTLMKIRMRPRNGLASFDEAWAVLQHYRKVFVFSDHDFVFICGGDQPDEVKSQCERHGINWVPYFDKKIMQSVIKYPEAPYNLFGIDANFSCSATYLNITKPVDRQVG